MSDLGKLRGADAGLETRLIAIIKHQDITRDMLNHLRRDFDNYILERAEAEESAAAALDAKPEPPRPKKRPLFDTCAIHGNQWCSCGGPPPLEPPKPEPPEPAESTSLAATLDAIPKPMLKKMADGLEAERLMDPVRELAGIAWRSGALGAEEEHSAVGRWIERYGPFIAKAVEYCDRRETFDHDSGLLRDMLTAYRAALEKGEPK